MFFGGELHKYVQFVTMLRNSFNKTINDSVALYKILLQQVKSPAKAAIESCIFSASSTDRYEEAMTILKDWYGQKNGVIRSHREELLNGKPITDSIADFEVLSNELKCFHSVLIHYNVNLQYFSGEIVRDVVAHCLSNRMGAEFTNLIHAKSFMDETALYLPR